MPQEKSILIGCDDTNTLSRMQFIIDQIQGHSLNSISTTSEYNLSGLVKSLKPTIIILCFRNNYRILNELGAVAHEKDTPVLCYHRRVESEKAPKKVPGITFSYAFEHLSKQGYLESGIVSVLRLLRRSDSTNFAAQNRLSNRESESRNLSRYVLELDQKMEILAKVKTRLKMIYPLVNDQVRTELNSIVNSIHASNLSKSVWDDFKLYFEEINPGFLSCLLEHHPDLTPIDLKYCCYIKMNMSNHDICNLLGINQESVRTHKYRLKRKMVLSKERDLHNYVMRVSEDLVPNVR